MTKGARFVKDDSGAAAIEYGLIAAIVSMSIILLLQNIRGAIKPRLTR
jgi:Flp pilus assembly pilin Flp